MDPDGRYKALRVLRAVILRCDTVPKCLDVYDNNRTFRAALDRQRQLLQAGDGDRVSQPVTPYRAPMENRASSLCRVIMNSLTLLVSTVVSQLSNAKAWAIRLRTDLVGDAMYVNECRSVCVELLFKLCDLWHEEKKIPQESLLRDFGLGRLVGLLEVSMPLDYAQCLYKMQYTYVQQYGMHWVAEQHIHENGGVWNDKLRRVGGRSTFNKRYLWLAELPGLPPENDAVLAACFQPRFAPWYLGEAEEVERDDNNMTDPVDVDFHALKQAIRECETVGDFRDVYYMFPFQLAMGNVRMMMGTMDCVRIDVSNSCRRRITHLVLLHTFLFLTAQNEWAREWAISMRANEPDPDVVFCDSVRQTLRLYLDRLLNCSQDPDKPAVSEESIVDVLERHRIANMMVLCLPMQLALCLHTRRYDFPEHLGKSSYGMCWFSEQDAQNDPWRKWREVGPATMPPSFQWLKNMERLELTYENLVVEWVKPILPDWAPDQFEFDLEFDKVMEQDHPLRRPFTA